MSRKGHRRVWLAVTVIALIAGSLVLIDCAGSLPRSERLTKSLWPTFAAAKAAYDRVQPGLTNVQTLQQMGYDPYGGSNVRILSYLDVSRHFLAGEPRLGANLPFVVQSCLAAQGACMGYEVRLERIKRERKGSAVLDMLYFRRRTHETGWRFRALFVIHHNLVVYKLWSGMPNIDRWIGADNPLGPVQEPADVIKRQIP